MESWSDKTRGQGAAMRIVLKQAWDAHFAVTGVRCPWEEEIASIPDWVREEEVAGVMMGHLRAACRQKS